MSRRKTTGLKRPVADADVAENLRDLHMRIDQMQAQEPNADLAVDGTATNIQMATAINALSEALRVAGIIRR